MSARGIIILLTGCVALGGLALIRSQRTASAPTPVPAVVSENEADSVKASAAVSVSRAMPLHSPPAATAVVARPPAPTGQLAVVEKPDTQAVLAGIGENLAAGDTGSLRRIAEQLRHAEPHVRRAAREALRDANDQALLPDIQFALEGATESQEVAELQELADYLELPSYTELAASGELTSAARAERQRVTSPLRAGRVAAGAAAMATPLPSSSASAKEQLAQLQAENQRLKQENAELRAVLNPLVAQ